MQTTNKEYLFKAERIDKVFETVESANEYYDFLIRSGYRTNDITVIMSKETKDKFYASNEHITDTANEALKGAGTGSIVGGGIGALVGAIAAVGTSIVLPALGIVIAGPLVGALAGAGAVGAGGALIGALTQAGLSHSAAVEYKNAMEKGHIIISVQPKDRHDVTLCQSYGRDIYNGYVIEK